MYQNTRDVAIWVWKYVVVTLVTASWITVYLTSKKLYLDIFWLLNYPLGENSCGVNVASG